MRFYDIAIIGGGAAGLFAAAIASDFGKKIVVLEKNDRCGRKIGITGKGRCNLTNTKPWNEFSVHVHPKSNFFKSAFYSMDNNGVMRFFEKIGLPLVVERGDRVYPKSMCARDVSDTLVGYVKSRGTDVITNFEVCEILVSQDISKMNQSLFKIANSNGNNIAAAKVIIATGGLSYPSTGSTGDGYIFAEKFGHSIISCFPSLTALLPLNYDSFMSMTKANISPIQLKNVEADLHVNGKSVSVEFGDLDFTNGGIEGPIGFKVSRRGVIALKQGNKVELYIDLKPAISVKQLIDRINRELIAFAGDKKTTNAKKANGADDAFVLYENHIYPLLRKLMPAVLIKPFNEFYKSYSRVHGYNIETLAEALKSWRFEIISNVGYERAVVTAGGISLDEISQKTMESKFVQGLYFAGEIINLDGDTGGYNLQIAFSTGNLAALNALKTL